jgi:long-chain acyl-CoA synthetase
VIVLGGGKKVAPEELERAYSVSPYIEEIAVLERGGALVGLLVADLAAIRAAGFTRVEDVLRVTLKELGARLPSHQRLAGFAIADTPLPRTRLGKLRRFLLADLYERALARRSAPAPSEISDRDRALLQSPKAQAVWRLVTARYASDRLSLDADLELDLGIDSLEWITLSLELQRSLGLRLDDAETAGLATVRDLLRYADKAQAEAAAPAPAGPAAGPDGAQWLEPTGAVTRLFTLLLYLLNRLVVRSFFRLRVSGLEALPRQGPLVVVANHCSDLDPLVVAAALPWKTARRIYWGGDAGRLFRRTWLRPFFRAAHVFPVDGRLPALSLSLAGEVLGRGDVLVWFPEEWRSPTGELQRFQPGLGRIIAATSAPALPAFIEGTFAALPRHRRWPRPAKVSLRFGNLIERRALPGGTGDEADPKQITEGLRAAMVKLAPGGAGD